MDAAYAAAESSREDDVHMDVWGGRLFSFALFLVWERDDQCSGCTRPSLLSSERDAYQRSCYLGLEMCATCSPGRGLFAVESEQEKRQKTTFMGLFQCLIRAWTRKTSVYISRLQELLDSRRLPVVVNGVNTRRLRHKCSSCMFCGERFAPPPPPPALSMLPSRRAGTFAMCSQYSAVVFLVEYGKNGEVRSFLDGLVVGGLK